MASRTNRNLIGERIALGRMPNAFSLIEVVLAIGIVSFAILTIMGVFGGLLKISSDNVERREILESVDSLRSFLNGTNFAAAYDWSRSGTKLLYVTYRASADGIPDPDSSEIVGEWMRDGIQPTASYESARSGRWLRARISVSPSNPGGTNLPPAADYTKATLFVLADIEAIAAPEQSGTNNARLQTTLVLHR